MMLRVETHADCRLLRLDRAPVNALDPSLLEALTAAVHAAPADGVRGLVLSGHGSLFSGGLDVRYLLAADEPAIRRLLGAFLDCLHALVTSPLPVVAAINGHSPAGGAVLALHCDVRFMARGAGKIGLNEVAVGLYPGALIHAVLTRTVGPRTAERLLSQGLLLDADEALAVGLIDAVTAPEDLDRESLQWLAAVAALPPTAYRRTRSLVRADLVQLVTDAAVTRRESVVAELAREWCSAEMRETLAALLARR